MDSVTLIKLGGSLVTHPAGPDGADAGILRQLAPDLARCPSPLVLIHGTGCVGKPAAVEHGYAGTGRIPPELTETADSVRADLYQLHHRIAAVLAECGLSIAPLDTRDILAPNGLDFQPKAFDRLQEAWTAGCIPLLTGDHLLQADGSQQILSSDTLIYRLAEERPTQHCFLLTNVDGVLDPDGNVLSTVSPEDLARLKFHSSDQKDVSGGMGGKLDAAFRAAAAVGVCMIGNGRTPGLLNEWISGRYGEGSRILPGEAES